MSAIFGCDSQHCVRSIRIHNWMARDCFNAFPTRNAECINRWNKHIFVRIDVSKLCVIWMIFHAFRFFNVLVNVFSNLTNFDLPVNF